MNKRRIILADCASGLLILGLGALAIAPNMLGRTWWLVLAATLVTGVATYVDEQRLEGASVRRRLAVYAGSVAAVGLLLVGAVVGASLGPGVAMTAGAAGFGLATTVNRLVFGVVYEIPRRRIVRAEKYSL